MWTPLTLIDLNDLHDRNAYNLLGKYVGINPYLKKMRNDYLDNKKAKLTEAQIKYVNENHDKEPVLLNRIVAVSTYLGEELQKTQELTFKPERILIQYMLAENDKTYHVYGKLKQNQKESKMYFLPKTQVLDDPYYEKIDVVVDFEPYNKILSKTGKKLYAHQEEAVKFLLGRKGCILADDMGLGKVLANDTPVLTPNGWVENGSLKVGDYVIGSNGKKTTVTGVYPKPEKNYYNITFTDGTVVESCDEHLWAVQTPTQKKRNPANFEVKELRQIASDMTQSKAGNIKWYIPMVQPVEFEKQSVKLDPYLLGALLGDGGISQSAIYFTSIDEDIITEISQRLPDGHTISLKQKQTYGITSDTSKNEVTRALSSYNLHGTKSNTKFIPNEYKYNSTDIRLCVLQGLLDTDGYCSKSDGTIQFYSVSKRLSDDVQELVQSFGGVARQSSKIGSYKNSLGEKVICQRCYILTINLPIDIIPFKLQRKIDNISKEKKYNPSRGIKKIEFSRRALGQCISVASEDHLYVMDKYVVTHNTMSSIIAALESGAKKILVVCPASVKINWEREINVFDKKTTIVSGAGWSQSKFTIINFDILKNYHTLNSRIKKATPEDPILYVNRQLVDAKFDIVIVDEAHNLKDSKSIRGELMVELAITYGIEKVWLLTGTPVANRPMDFFNLLKLIRAPIADNWSFFAKRYCEGKQINKMLANGLKRKIWLTSGASNLEELNMKTKNIMLRRLKKDTVDMPDKVISPTYHELSKQALCDYEMLWEEYLLQRKKLKKKGTVERDLVELILLRQFIAKESIQHTIEMTENALAMERKVIIFTTFSEEQELLVEHFGKLCVSHNGSMSASQKQNSVDMFQNKPKVKVFIGNIRSAGVGITLTEASVVIFNSFEWVPGWNQQAEDRAFRIGQKNDVNVYYNLFVNSISTRMWATLANKQDVIDTIMGVKVLTDAEKLELIIEKFILENDSENIQP